MSSFLIQIFKDHSSINKSVIDTFTNASQYLTERSSGNLNVTTGKTILIGYSGKNGIHYENDDLIIIVDGDILINQDHNEFNNNAQVDKHHITEFITNNWNEYKEKIINYLEGNFVLFIHDKAEDSSYLYRDKFGMKSIAYKENSDSLYISSEIKFILPLVKTFSINDIALKESILFRWNTDELQLLDTFKQVPFACYIHIDKTLTITKTKYWDFKFTPEAPTKNLQHYVDKLDVAVKDFFHSYDLNNKTVGVFLSGGVDSSVLAAVANQECKSCIGFIGKVGEHDEEAKRALIIAEHLGIECHVVPIKTERLKSDFIKMTNRVGTLARNQNNLVLLQIIEYAADHVDTILEGDATEMLFGLSFIKGVRDFSQKRKIIEKFIPRTLQLMLARQFNKSDKNLFVRLSRLLSSTVLDFAMYCDLLEYKSQSRRAIANYTKDVDVYLKQNINPFKSEADIDDALAIFQYYTFLPSSLLRFDTLSQPFGVNILAPFLYHKVVDVSITLPREYRYTSHYKVAVNELCDRYFPDEISRWKKLGFPVPWKQWLQQELSELCEETFECDRIKSTLPKEFLTAIESTRDPEGLWSVISLKYCLDSYDKYLNNKL